MAELPDSFDTADAFGRKGYVEFGFSSTTSEMQIALEYSGIKEGNLNAMVIELEATAIDRGGCVKAFSQYPQVIFFLIFLFLLISLYSAEFLLTWSFG